MPALMRRVRAINLAFHRLPPVFNVGVVRVCVCWRACRGIERIGTRACLLVGCARVLIASRVSLAIARSLYTLHLTAFTRLWYC